MKEQDDKDGMAGLLTELGVVPPERNSMRTLNADQQEIVNAYRAGKMEETEFQRHLSEDEALADYIATLARPSDPGAPSGRA